MIEARHIAQGADLEWQAKVFHEEMDKLGVPRHDGEDFYSLYGRANLARAALAAQPVAQSTEAAAWKWGYEYLQSRMESIGRHGWAHDCDGEIEARIAAAPSPGASKPVQAEAPSDELVIEIAQAAGFRWIPPDDDPDGYPGGFDMSNISEMRNLLGLRRLAAHSPASGVGERT